MAGLYAGFLPILCKQIPYAIVRSSAPFYSDDPYSERADESIMLDLLRVNLVRLRHIRLAQAERQNADPPYRLTSARS
jgi:hypothetical protein